MAAIHKLTSGGLMVNYRCQASCGHCLYASCPQRQDDYISPALALAVFTHVKALGAPSMHISGGEPFMHVEKLIAVLEAARTANMPIDYIETSSSWVNDEASARHILRMVKALCVTTLSLSISPYHNEYIPLDSVLLLYNACREEGISAPFWIDEFFPDLTALPTGTTHTRQEFEQLFGKRYWDGLRGRYALNMLGRAPLTHAGEMPLSPTTRIPHMSRSCAELCGRSHYHIDCFGRYVPPGCPGISLPMDALGTELSPERFPLYTRLAQEPRQLLDYCKAQGFIPKQSYYNRCHLCQEMRLFLFVKYPGRFEELAPEGFYHQLLKER